MVIEVGIGVGRTMVSKRTKWTTTRTWSRYKDEDAGDDIEMDSGIENIERDEAVKAFLGHLSGKEIYLL